MVVTGTHDPYLVALSILVASFASYTALDLSGHVGPARPGTRSSPVAGGHRDDNGRRNMVDALPRHARLHHTDTDVLRHQIDHPFARGGDLRNRRRLLRHWSPERIAASPRSQRHLNGTWHCRHALHRHDGNAGARRAQLRPAIR